MLRIIAAPCSTAAPSTEDCHSTLSMGHAMCADSCDDTYGHWTLVRSGFGGKGTWVPFVNILKREPPQTGFAFELRTGHASVFILFVLLLV